MKPRDRRYIIVAINERTSVRVVCSREDEPLTHAQACTIMKKMTVHKGRRLQLEEV